MTNKHSAKCEFAKGDLCRCSCEGDLHGIRAGELDERKNIREDIGDITNKCIKCGEDIHVVNKWKNYYCNHYCCSPCCPDAYTAPCTKEMLEKFPGAPETYDAKLIMEKHLIRKGLIVRFDGFQRTIQKYLEGVNSED